MIYNRCRANCNRQLLMESPGKKPLSSARTALFLLLGINLFNYIDRYVLSAVEPEIRAHFFAPSDPNAHALTGLLGTAFLVSYMIAAPKLPGAVAPVRRGRRGRTKGDGRRGVLTFGGNVRSLACECKRDEH